MATTYLDSIVSAHREAARSDRRSLDVLVAEAARAPSVRGFAAALSAPGLGVVAEVKRRSPSKGELRADLDAGRLAEAYERGGAVCISVLTDVEFFGGSAADLAEVRSRVDLPVLRKDFTVDARDVADARIMGADAVLLIASALSDAELDEYLAVALEVGIDALVEVHDEVEVGRALAAGATSIGVNQRDLYTFEVDTDRAVRVRAAIPDGLVTVAESGITGAADARRLAEAGFDAVLVGEHLVRSDDPASTVAALTGG